MAQKNDIPRALVIGFAMIAACFGPSIQHLHAQLDVPGPLHLTHVAGYVVTSQGKPLANTEVSLVRDDTVVHEMQTDKAGAFHFDHVSGRYTFRVARSEYAPAAREIYVEPEIATALQRKKLYVIVGPGACTDECSSVFSDKHDFERAIQKLNRH